MTKQTSNSDNKYAAKIAIIAISLILGSCGFALRGAGSSDSLPNILKDQGLSLSCDASQLFYFCQGLRTQLSLHDIAENPNSAFRLSINPLKQDQRVFTLERDASAAEFELKRGVRFVIESKTQAVPLVEKDLFRESIFRDSDATKISKDRERSRLENTLDDELVNAVIRELSFIKLDPGTTNEY